MSFSAPVAVPGLRKFIEQYRIALSRPIERSRYKSKVAIIDNGFITVANRGKTNSNGDQIMQSEFSERIKDAESFVSKGQDKEPWYFATAPHGTQMANLICAIDPNCELYVVKAAVSNNEGITAKRVKQVSSKRQSCHPSIEQ